MSKVTSHISISLDGFVAGPNQSPENPLGEGGERLHDWVVATESWRAHHGKEGGERGADSEVAEEVAGNIGAQIMGRNMFGPPSGGPWDESWRGWWGEDPPFHTPVYVLTHHPREPVEMQGGTTYHFVTDGIETALERAREAADGKDVALGGGASVAQQYLQAGLVDEMTIHLVPILLGGGARLFDNLGTADLAMECVRAIHAPGVAHLTYRAVT